MVSGLSALGPSPGDFLPRHPHQEQGAVPHQHLPACKSHEACMRLRGCSLRDSCGQGRSPTSTGKQPPSPQLTQFLGDLGHTGSLNIHLNSIHFEPD